MNKTIVITSIFSATPSIRRWADLSDWNVIVVGDQKTPRDWSCHPAAYLSVADQESAPFQIARMLPWNHYARKLMGYLVAIQQGAEIILDTDDDNMPKSDWSIPEFLGNYPMAPPGLGFINIYGYFTDQHIWPRGFPLNRVCDPAARLVDSSLQTAQVRIGIWQGLADGDPDVDAIYRMTVNTPCFFDTKPPVVLNHGTVSPFNSQNTAFIKPVFPLLYLPASVSFRSTDIIRGLVAQPILWSAGYLLGFTGATVVQDRNDHHYLSDFESEIPCYLYPEKIMNVVEGAVSSRSSIETNLINAYESLIRHDLIPKCEMDLVLAWVQDIQDMTGTKP
ncbi:MAG: DUF288 domain-containing protein [Deltaproteobacteria bacterium]|nr:DUF288 domain-containing protein [Deltaproteobacteria bacterium]